MVLCYLLREHFLSARRRQFFWRLSEYIKELYGPQTLLIPVAGLWFLISWFSLLRSHRKFLTLVTVNKADRSLISIHVAQGVKQCWRCRHRRLPIMCIESVGEVFYSFVPGNYCPVT